LETYDSDALSSLGEATARHYRSQAAKPSLSTTESRMRDEYRSGARLIAAELERRGLSLPPHLQKLVDTSAKAASKRTAGRGGPER